MLKKGMFGFLALAVVVAGAIGSYSSTSSRPDLYGMLPSKMMPAPDETIIIDDDMLIPIQIMDNFDRYWAVQFIPDSLCSLKAGLIAISVGMTAPQCSLFVWNDIGGMPAEPPVFDTTFTAAGFPTWANVIIDPAYITADTFWIGYWLPNAGFPDPEQDVPMCDISPPGMGSMEAMFRPAWGPVWMSFLGMMDLGVRAVVNYYTAARHDVEPTQIFGLLDTVYCDTSYNLEAEVYNSGDSTESFDVILEIDTTGGIVFADTQQVVDLVSLAYDTVAFAPVIVPQWDSTDYGVLVFTELAGDDSTENDSLIDSTFGYCLWVRDVGPTAVLNPGDTVYCDSTYPIQARVENFGQQTETFDVNCKVDSSGVVFLDSTKTVTGLMPDSTFDLTFSTGWQVPLVDGMDYGITIATLLAEDDSTQNDTLVDTTSSECLWVRDVGPTQVLSPGDSVYCDSLYMVMARVENFGDQSETFDVNCKIDSSGVVFFDSTKTVTDLGVGLTEDVTFSTGWQVPLVDGMDYGITIATLLAGDDSTQNDTLVDTTTSECLWIRDVGPTAVLSPGDSVYCDSVYVVEARVENFGQAPETFDVRCQVDSSGSVFLDSIKTVSNLAAGDSVDVTFSTGWQVPLVDAMDYGITITTLLVGDAVPANDVLVDTTTSKCLWIRDVGPTAVLSPGDTVYCDSTYPIQARVENFGEQTETFDVNCKVDSSGFVFLDSTKTVTGLGVGLTEDVTFSTGWQVPLVDAMDYGITITTLLVGDAVPANDVLVDTTTSKCLWIRDVGPIAVLSPGDTVNCDSTYPIQARVENFGQLTETFDVRCQVDSSGSVFLDSTKTVTGLGVGLTEDVTFSTGWQVPLVDAMDYGITITTLLVGDAVPANDVLVDTTSSKCLWIEDVAPVLIVWPEDTVYCSSSGDPTARVTNLGQISATFDVVFIIDTSGVGIYGDTVTVTDLAPAETTDAVFGSWTVPDVDGINYDLTAWTMLPGDVDMSNDTLGGASWGMCLPWEDVYPSWVVWPGDTVLCDSSDTVRVKVVNAGGLDASFDVVIQIDTNMTVIWSDTATVTNLLPGDSADAVFDEWTVPDLDSTTYGITSWTLLGSDSLPANDTLVTSTFGYCFRVHDVGILGRVAPPDTVLCEQIYSVMVDVMNYGDYVEDFDVICTIEDTGAVIIHEDTMTVLGLDPDSSRTATFGSSWTVPNVDTTYYSVTFYSELAGDFNATNDTVSDSIFGYCQLVVVRDVGPVIILNPPDTVFCDSTVAVSAWVKNFGTEQEFFNVECIMDTSLPVYADTQAVPGLDPGDSVIVNFLNWPVPGADSTNYTMTVTTLLAADTIYSNDTLAKPVFGYCALIHDCGIDSIEAPPDTVAIDSTYTPRVSVHNWGDFMETFDIICTIDGYDDTVQVVDMLPGVSTDIPFASWSASMPGSYLMSVVIELTDDGNAENDTASKTIEAVTGIYDQYVLPRVPLESGLLQNVPNPLSVYTHIYYQVAASGEASLSVYDLAGRLVKVLFEGFVEPGYYSARWEGDDETGNPVPSGIYIYKLRIGKEEASKKLVVVR